MSTISNFKSNFQGGGARANLFEVVLNIPSVSGGTSRQLSFLAKAASLPGSAMAAVEIPYRGRQLKVAGDRTFEPWSITILNDTDFKIRSAFEDWVQAISRNDANISSVSGLNSSNYMIDMDVHQRGRQGEKLKSYKFHDAWPSSIGAIELAFDSNDAIEEFEVEMTYQYWTSV